MTEDCRSSTSFGAGVDAYEAGRPEYPEELIRWVLEPVLGRSGRPRVADVAAGTGKLTRGVVATGGEVVAVDPDEAMLEKLRGVVPGVPTFVGTAESLPLDDGCVDAVVLGQAWHWVDPLAGSREIARVLRPGGVLGLLWNLRDEAEPWVAGLNAAIPRDRSQEMLAAGTPPVATPFDQPDEQVRRWTQRMTRSSLGDMVRSRSSFITATPDQRAALDQDLNELFDEIGVDDDAIIDLPYATHAYRAVLP